MSTDTTIRDDKPAIPETARDISANLEALEDCVEQALGVALRELAEAQETGGESRYPTGFIVGMQAVLAHTNAVRWTYEVPMREELMESIRELREHAERVEAQAQACHSIHDRARRAIERMRDEIQVAADEVAREHAILFRNRPPVKD